MKTTVMAAILSFFAAGLAAQAQDTTAPGSITLLTSLAPEAPNPIHSSARLNWPAVGDNGMTGGAVARYWLGYSISGPSTSPSNPTIPTNPDNTQRERWWVAATTIELEMVTPLSPNVTQTFTVSGLTEDLTYYFAVRAFDAAGNVSTVSNIVNRVLPDRHPPSAVTDLVAATVAGLDTSVRISWTEPFDNSVAGSNNGALAPPAAYELRYRAGTSFTTEAEWLAATPVTGMPVPFGAPGVASQSMTVPGLSPETSYVFVLRTRDEATNLSAFSNAVTFTTADLTAPSSPTLTTDLPVVASGSPHNETNAIRLRWPAPSENGMGGGRATYYQIARSTSAVVATGTPTRAQWEAWWMVAGTPVISTGLPSPATPGTEQDYTVIGLASDTTYHFCLRSSDEALNISYSTAASRATADFYAPSPIADLAVTAIANSDRGVAITWTAPFDNDPSAGPDFGTLPTGSAYEIRYRIGSAFDAGQWNAADTVSVTQGIPNPAAPGTSQTLNVTNLLPGTSYVFGIRTRDETSSPPAAVRWSVPGMARSFVTPDLTAPAQIAITGIAPAGEQAVQLMWAAPLDNPIAGVGVRAARYDVRYSLLPISDATWSAATPVQGRVPAPGLPGVLETIVADSLPADQMIFFASKAVDAAVPPNFSALSNVVNLQTSRPYVDDGSSKDGGCAGSAPATSTRAAAIAVASILLAASVRR